MIRTARRLPGSGRRGGCHDPDGEEVAMIRTARRLPGSGIITHVLAVWTRETRRTQCANG